MRYRTHDIDQRTAEEISKLGRTPREIARLLSRPTQLIRSWLDGTYTPSATSLRMLHDAGCEILYILTGKHYTITGGDSDVRHEPN
jgi:hypothetical protein